MNKKIIFIAISLILFISTVSIVLNSFSEEEKYPITYIYPFGSFESKDRYTMDEGTAKINLLKEIHGNN